MNVLLLWQVSLFYFLHFSSQLYSKCGVDYSSIFSSTIFFGTVWIYICYNNIFTSYGYVYDAINGSKDVINSSNFYWDSIQKVYYVRDKKYSKIKSENEVFGWHPYWMGSAWESYPFELLSTISYFSYKLDPNTGSYSNPRQMEEWRTTAMIDSAKLKKTKVDI